MTDPSASNTATDAKFSLAISSMLHTYAKRNRTQGHTAYENSEQRHNSNSNKNKKNGVLKQNEHDIILHMQVV